MNYYNDTPFVKLLERRIPVSMTIGNDAIVMVLGTGIGGCLVKDHRVIVGKHFAARE